MPNGSAAASWTTIPVTWGRCDSSPRSRARQGRAADAMAYLERAIAADPRSAEAHMERANLLNAQARFTESIEACDHALALRDDLPEPFVIRGVALHGLGRYEEALADFDRALALRPAFAGVLANRGAALKDLERYDEALAAYDRALAIDPDQPEALTNRGAVLVELARFEEALASCDRAVARMPRFHEAWHNRGVALVGLKRYDEAIVSYSNALSVKPDFRAVAAKPRFRARLSQDVRPRPGRLRQGAGDRSGASFPARQRRPCTPALRALAGSRGRVRAARGGGARGDARVRAAQHGRGRRTMRQTSARARSPGCSVTIPTSTRRSRAASATVTSGSASRICRRTFTSIATAYLMAEVFERHDRVALRGRGGVVGTRRAERDAHAPRRGVRPLRRRARAMSDDEVARWLRERRDRHRGRPEGLHRRRAARHPRPSAGAGAGELPRAIRARSARPTSTTSIADRT